MGDSRQNISSGRTKQTAEFQGVQRAIQKPAFWRMGDVATLSVQIESTDHIHPTGRQEPVKKADREVRLPGDVRAPSHDHFTAYDDSDDFMSRNSKRAKVH